MVWTGRGASHSWIWWADALEDLCWLRVDFATGADDLITALGGRDLLLLGGGDASALRTAIDWDGVQEWVEAGGRLVATCAGGYLLRAWASVGIANAVDEPPPRASLRAWSRCEDGIVVHPVRGPVSLASERGATFTAPLFGGPFFRQPEGGPARIAARYTGVAPGAEWLLADRPELLEHTPAVVTADLGRGRVVLSGPHLEHPDHPAAHLWLANVLGWEPGEPVEGAPPPMPGTDPDGEEVVRRLASVRRRAASISEVAWRSGEKLWTGDRVAGFAEAVIPRARALARWGWGPRGKASGLMPLLDAAFERMGVRDDPLAWDGGFAALSEASAVLMDAYFASRRGGMPPTPSLRRPPPRLWPEDGFHAPTAPPRGGRARREGVGRR